MIVPTMFSGSHIAAGCAALVTLALPGCGYVGLELLQLDAASYAEVVPSEGGAAQGDGGPDLDAQSRDATSNDASAIIDGAVTNADGAAADAADVGDSALADAATGDAASDVDAMASDAGDAGPLVCDLSGSWALQVTSTVNWPQGVLASGAGTATFWFKLTGTQSGTSLPGTLQPCGLVLPDFSLLPIVGNETYGIRFPNSLFDTLPPQIAPIATTLMIGGTAEPGHSILMPQTAIVAGTTLADPVNTTWPTLPATLVNNDNDNDGRLGVTASYANDATHVFPRVDAISRADLGYAASRFAFSASGSITSCSEFGGPINFSHFDTHLVGCHVSGGGNCSTAQRDTLDSARPLFNPTTANFRAIKVDPTTTCAAIRAMLP